MNKFFSLLILIISISFISCAQTKSTDSFTAMNTFMTLSVYASGKKGEQVCGQIHQRINELESILSTTLPSSDLYYLNHNKKNREPLSPELKELFDFSEAMYTKTSGAFNPALYPVIREWGFTTESYKVPSDEKIARLLSHTDFSKLQTQASRQSIILEANMELDFGAVGKGYAADQAVLILQKNGITSALLDFGGNIQAHGKKPDGSLWRVGIKNPWDGGVACALSVESKAVVTSGGYERFFEDEEGNRYIHIFDPETGRPSQSDLESVTIVCQSGCYADALSTALFVMGKEGAIKWWKENHNFDFILISKSGELIYSEGLEGFIEALYPFQTVTKLHY